MKKLSNACICFAFLFFVVPSTCLAQDSAVKVSSKGDRLFESDKILEITISGNVKDLCKLNSDIPVIQMEQETL